MHLRSVIQQLGYTPAEATVYLTALKLGGSTVTDIATKAGMPRTSVQFIVEDLRKKGLMSSYLERRRKVWAAENPDKLLLSLKEREMSLARVLPELKALRHATGAKPTVRTYVGAEEIRQMMNDIIDAKHSISAILSWDAWIALLGKDFVYGFIENRTRHFLDIRLIAPRTKTSLVLRQKDHDERRTTRFLPEGVEITNSTFIYADKVSMISLNERRPTGVLIEDPDIRRTMEVLFEGLWQQCSDI